MFAELERMVAWPQTAPRCSGMAVAA
jgi:hypothetical protein